MDPNPATNPNQAPAPYHTGSGPTSSRSGLWPVIHLVTPSFNQAPFLEQTIRSVLDQRYPNLRYGVVDGGSDDGSTRIIERYRDRLGFAIIEPDEGQTDALNKGLSLAPGLSPESGLADLAGEVDGGPSAAPQETVLGWLCSDDYLLPGALVTVGRYFAENPDCRWLIAAAWMVRADGTRCHTVRPNGDFSVSGMIERGEDRPLVVPQPSVFWRSGLTAELGLLDRSLHYAMDFEYWLRFVAAGHRPHLIHNEISAYRLHDRSKTVAASAGFDREHDRIERRYARTLRGSQRRSAMRMIGYRQRRRLLADQPGVPWRALLRHPWWIGSQQIRRRLIARIANRLIRDRGATAPEHAASPATWDRLYQSPDPHLAASRLERERWSCRWQTLRSHLRRRHGFDRLDCVELGCGGGDISILLAELGHRVTLVDFSEPALEHARHRFAARGLSDRAHFVRADLFDPPAELLDRFDVATSLGVAEHFSGNLRREAVEAHRRVLRPGGTVFISVPNTCCWPYRAWKAWLELRDLWPYGYEAPYSGRALKAAARRAGLEHARTFQTGFAGSVDGCLIQPVLGRRLGWREGPAWLNRLAGWDVNLIATRPAVPGVQTPGAQRRAA